jgi:hypothetical protein
MLYEVLGIGGGYKLLLPESGDSLVALDAEIPLHYEVLEASHLSGKMSKGGLTKISSKAAEARLEAAVPALSNLKMRLVDGKGKEMPGTLYGKVLGTVPGNDAGVSIRFTSVSPEIAALLSDLTSSRDLAAKAQSANGAAPQAAKPA